MNYINVYNNIINNAKFRGLDKKMLHGYFEKHHIIPKCLGGKNKDTNYVLLTGREHVICHYLLWKSSKSNMSLMSGYHKMVYQHTKYQDRTLKITSKQYELLRIANSNKMKLNNPMKNKNSVDGMKKTKQRNKDLGLYKKTTYSDEYRYKLSERMKANNPMLKNNKHRKELFIGPHQPVILRMKVNNPMKNKDICDKVIKTQKNNRSIKRKDIISLKFSQMQLDNITDLYLNKYYSKRAISMIYNCEIKLINFIIIEYSLIQDKIKFKEVSKQRIVENMKMRNPNKFCYG